MTKGLAPRLAGSWRRVEEAAAEVGARLEPRRVFRVEADPAATDAGPPPDGCVEMRARGVEGAVQVQSKG